MQSFVLLRSYEKEHLRLKKASQIEIEMKKKGLLISENPPVKIKVKTQN